MSHLRAWSRRPDGPLVYGHRGAASEAPENTMAAFELAADAGADGIELDVRLDGAGEVVVLHDPTLARVTEGADDRAVEALQRRDLEAIDVGEGERVPRLTQVLDWARARRFRVNVEVKSDVTNVFELCRRVAALVRAVPDAERYVLLSSLHPGVLVTLGRLAPNVPRGWIVWSGQRLIKRAPGFRLLGAHAVHPERVLTAPAQVRAWRRAGALINVWTVNDPIEAHDLAASGVDGLITDDPKAIIDAIR